MFLGRTTAGTYTTCFLKVFWFFCIKVWFYAIILLNHEILTGIVDFEVVIDPVAPSGGVSEGMIF